MFLETLTLFQITPKKLHLLKNIPDSRPRFQTDILWRRTYLSSLNKGVLPPQVVDIHLCASCPQESPRHTVCARLVHQIISFSQGSCRRCPLNRTWCMWSCFTKKTIVFPYSSASSPPFTDSAWTKAVLPNVDDFLSPWLRLLTTCRNERISELLFFRSKWKLSSDKA